jgi:hypothetical protein
LGEILVYMMKKSFKELLNEAKERDAYWTARNEKARLI